MTSHVLIFRAKIDSKARKKAEMELSFYNCKVEMLREELNELNSTVLVYQTVRCMSILNLFTVFTLKIESVQASSVDTEKCELWTGAGFGGRQSNHAHQGHFTYCKTNAQQIL